MLTLAILLTPFVDFRKDLLESLNVLIEVKSQIIGVTSMSSIVLIGDRPFILPFSVKILPPSK